jgi:transcriptional regulator with XRE-family HTH domain
MEVERRGCMATFGETIKQLRLKRFGLREFAKRVGISATYLSKMERGLDPPPVEEKIIRMAEVLEADPNKLLALAQKLPPDFKKAFTKNRTYTSKLPEFLRTVAERNLTPEEWEELIEKARRKTK